MIRITSESGLPPSTSTTAGKHAPTFHIYIYCLVTQHHQLVNPSLQCSGRRAYSKRDKMRRNLATAFVILIVLCSLTRSYCVLLGGPQGACRDAKGNSVSCGSGKRKFRERSFSKRTISNICEVARSIGCEDYPDFKNIDF